jgi:NADH-quinone oxidoreductase subunit G
MPTLKIDGKEITVEPGTTILQAALRNGIEIPHYCYHPALEIAGSCRLCLVELDNSPKLVTSCSIEARDGMDVRTQTDKVKDARRSVLEFLLINHPLDCPVCDKAGECMLQDYTFKYGSAHSRFVEDKRERKPKDLGGNILLYRNRCILCSRCVRFYEDVVGEPYLLVENRGFHSDISTFPGKGLTHKMTGNIVEICPVGCLIDKDFLFNARVWNLEKTRSVCPGCSSGCNINIEFMNHKIYRLRAAENMQVNAQWICDDGRYIYHRYENLPRFLKPQIRRNGQLQPVSWTEALDEINVKLALHTGADGSLAVAGSAFATNEENYLLKINFPDEVRNGHFFIDQAGATGEDVTFKSGFTIHGDKAPNSRGAKTILGKNEEIWTALESGQIKRLVFFNGNVDMQLTGRQRELLAKLELLVVFDVVQSPLAEWAQIILPVAYFAENDGTYVNYNGQVQRIRPALKPEGDTKPGWLALSELYYKRAANMGFGSAADVFISLADDVAAFSGMTYFKLGESGLKIAQE